jgi:uncharacterized protein YbjT (DUF2867 family)
MAGKKIIAVFGATGAQGGGMTNAILDEPHGEFAVRALTRNPGSDAARALAARGAEVAGADLDDEDSVRNALDGAYGAFVVTAFWEYMSAERELAQVRAAASAAKAAGLAHVVWSTLPDTRKHIPLDDDQVPTLQGKYKVPHFDGKGEADRLFVDAGVPTTNLSTTFFFESFITSFPPRRCEDGRLLITLPIGQAKLPGIAVEDIGRTALGIFKRGRKYIGETVNVSGENLTGLEYAARMAKEFGEEIDYRPMGLDAVRALDHPAADEIANMFHFYTDYEDVFAGARDPEFVRTLNPRLQTFATWLAHNRDRFTV